VVKNWKPTDMQNPLQTEQAKDTFLLIARVAIGVYFLLAGYKKIATGVDKFATEHAANVPQYVSPEFGRHYLQVLPYAEMIVGLTMVIGLYTKLSAGLMSLILVSFILATGVGFKPGNPQINENFVYLGLTLLLMHFGGGKVAVDQSMGKAPGPAKK
jgi:putative oxidoreductase